MKFRIADSFAKALGKLNARERSAVKVTVFDLQQDPSAPGLRFHRVDGSKDRNFWSVRADRDIRVIVHKTADSFLVCHAGRHDDAYAWAERRRIETHPKTGAAQIVEVRERVEDIAVPAGAGPQPALTEAPARFKPPLFLQLSRDDLLGVGVPEDWLDDVHNASEDNFLDLADHMPAEAAEALLDYAATGILRRPGAAEPGASPFDHPDAQRRFRVLDDVAELERALAAPWDRWTVFLHPAQRRVATQAFNGPARVSGSAGTGKTVVALHRVAAVLQRDPDARVLLTTFSAPLASVLARKLRLLTGNADGATLPAVTVLPFEGVARELFTLAFGQAPRAASGEQVKTALDASAADLELTEFTSRFVVSEWTNVVDAWQIDSLDAYAQVPRLGRRNRLGAKQRERLWPLFVRARQRLASRGLDSQSGICARVTSYYAGRDRKPFSHIVVDEAQDLGVPELRMLAAIADRTPDALFFAGDLGQRIFKEPFSWKALGVDIRGRSHTLKVNYRTSHQIRQASDRLLPPRMCDVDGNEEDRTGTVSVFNGPDPEIRIFNDGEREIAGLALWIYEAVEDGIDPGEIGVFVRGAAELRRARAVVTNAGQVPLALSDRVEDRAGRIAIGAMHLAKGLEFKAVVVMACDDDVLPSQQRIETVANQAELDDVYETERRLLYVACTRARDRLLVSGIEPASEFLADMDLSA